LQQVLIPQIFFLYTDNGLVSLNLNMGGKTMKRISIIALAFGLTVMGLLEARAAEMEVNMEAELKAVSAFVWRGRTLNEDPCFQPSFTIGTGNFSANLWGSWNLTSLSNSWQSSRVDAMFDYKFIMGRHLIRPGFTAYIYHDDPAGKAKDTYECFVDYTYDAFLLPSMTVYYDFSKIDGFFATMSVKHSFTLIEDRIALDLKLQLEGADKNFNNALFKYADTGDEQILPEKSSLVDVTAVAALPIKVWKTGVLTPALKYVMLLDSTTKDIVDAAGQDANILVYSLAYSMTF
jgi:hypothetical protein